MVLINNPDAERCRGRRVLKPRTNETCFRIDTDVHSWTGLRGYYKKT